MRGTNALSARPETVGDAGQFGAAGGLKVASFREIFGVDLRTLALFRMALGGFLILDLCLRARDLVAHYTDFGVMPRAALVDFLSDGAFSLHMINGTAAFQAGLFAIAGLFAAMMMLGWRTQLATIMSWALLLSLQNRNPAILSGEDHLVMVLMFWAMFLPLGARYSVDAALTRDAEDAPPRGNVYFSLATLALLIQGMSMYFFSALLKSDARWIPDGTAVYYALQLDYFATPVALWFRQFETLLQGLTYYVWALELIGPLLIFSPLLHRPLRAACMAAFITMHMGFFLCLEIGIFPLISIIMNLAFMPGWMWDGIARFLPARRSEGLRIWYDRDCGFCHKTCLLLRTFLFLSAVPIRPAQDDATAGALLEQHYSWVVSDGDRNFIKWDAMRHLVGASPVFGWAAPVLGWRPLKAMGDRFYMWVGENREALGRLTGALLPWRTRQPGPGLLVSALAAFFLVFVTLQNLSTLPGLKMELPGWFKNARQTFGLYQNWTMFAPYPEVTSPWPVIAGERRDGMAVDVYRRKEGIPSYSKPELVSAVYANYRWRKFLSNLEDDSYDNKPQTLALNYARYLCRAWNVGAPEEKMLSTFTLTFMVEWTPPPGGAKTAKQRSVWFHDCFG